MGEYSWEASWVSTAGRHRGSVQLGDIVPELAILRSCNAVTSSSNTPNHYVLRVLVADIALAKFN